MLILNLHKEETRLCCLNDHLNKHKVLTFSVKFCPLCLKNMFPTEQKIVLQRHLILLCLQIKTVNLTKILHK